jgi:hypothetical protein
MDSAFVDRPRKKPRGLLMPPGKDDVPEANKFTYKAKGKGMFDPDPEEGDGEGDGHGETLESPPLDYSEAEENAEDEDEDEFAKMVSRRMNIGVSSLTTS